MKKAGYLPASLMVLRFMSLYQSALSLYPRFLRASSNFFSSFSVSRTWNRELSAILSFHSCIAFAYERYEFIAFVLGHFLSNTLCFVYGFLSLVIGKIRNISHIVRFGSKLCQGYDTKTIHIRALCSDFHFYIPPIVRDPLVPCRQLYYTPYVLHLSRHN